MRRTPGAATLESSPTPVIPTSGRFLQFLVLEGSIGGRHAACGGVIGRCLLALALVSALVGGAPVRGHGQESVVHYVYDELNRLIGAVDQASAQMP